MDESKVKEIKSAEEQARKILEEAKHEYSKIIHLAGEKGLELFEKEKHRVKENVKSETERYRSEGEKEAKAILSTLDGELKKAEQGYGANKAKAVDYLIQKIKVKYGHR